MTVREIMHVGEALPLASPDSPMTEILCIMTGKGFGCVGIMEKGILVGKRHKTIHSSPLKKA